MLLLCRNDKGLNMKKPSTFFTRAFSKAQPMMTTPYHLDKTCHYLLISATSIQVSFVLEVVVPFVSSYHL